MPAVENDPSPQLAEYAHPEKLVTADWLAAHLDDPDVVIVESDEDVLLYDTGHIPGAVKVDWHTELNDQVTRDYVDGEGFARLMSEKGIGRDSTVVFYGDNFNWWAAYALWVFSLFDHPDVRLLDGGRMKWVADGRPMTTDVAKRPNTDYPVIERDDSKIRAYKEAVLDHMGAEKPMVDVRSPEEFRGERTHMPEYPQEGVLRGGHIPGRRQRALEAGGQRRRHVQDRPRPEGHLRRRDRAELRRRHRRLLPHRGAVEPHLVRAHPAARLPDRPQLRRLVDRVGQLRPGPDREAVTEEEGP